MQRYYPSDGKYYEARSRIIEHKLEGLSAVIDARLKAMDEALRLKAGELERRLETMSKSIEKERNQREDFVPRDIFEAYTMSANKCRDDRDNSLTLFREVYNTAHSQLANRITIVETRIITWTTSIATLFVLLQLALKYLEK